MRNLIFVLLCLCGATVSALAAPMIDGHSSRKGDLDSLLQQRTLRVLVTYDNAYYFLRQGAQAGVSVGLVREFQQWLNERYFANQKLKLKVLFIPVRQDQLLPLLNAGQGDLVVANTTVTSGRRQMADFSIPEYRGIQELLVSDSSMRPIRRLSELSGKRIWVRQSSSYHESLLALNLWLRAKGLPPVHIELADESLQDSDLLQRVHSGAIAFTLVDSHKARLWQRVFPGLQLHKSVPLRHNAHTAWAFRKRSPLLAREVNAFLRQYRKGTRRGEPIYRRYLEPGRELARRYQATSQGSMGLSQRDRRYVQMFQKYGDRYDFDWLMLLAQAFQESTLNPHARSHRGAMGIMQVLPSTAREPYINVRNIGQVENNIHAGTKYMRYMLDHYFDDAGLDETNRYLFTFAAYNAGPNRIARLRREAARLGLDPNVWSDNVEKVAARRIGQETVRYVNSIAQRYFAYRRTLALYQEKNLALTR